MLSSGRLTLTLPRRWAQSAAAAGLPGLTLESTAGAGSPSGAQLVVGMARADSVDVGLLPSDFVRDLKLPTPEAVRLAGGASAYRYDGLAVPGVSGPVSVLAAPTDAGVATVACIGADAACLHAAESLTIHGAHAYPLGPSRDYADALNRGLASLDTVLATKTQAMRRAKSARRQGAVAAAISAAFTRVARDLRALTLSPADVAVNRRMIERIRAAAAGYGDLARAARADQTRNYRRAAERIRREHGRLTDAVAATGYAAMVRAKLSTPHLPELRRPPRAAPTATSTPRPVATPTPAPQRSPTPVRPTPTPTPILPTPTPIIEGR
jgi:hypothetical protein